MKAKISKTGMLTIIPENETEMYALRMWSLQYDQQEGAGIDIMIEEDKEGEK